MLHGIQTVYLKHLQLITNRILITSTKSLSYSALPETLSFHRKESERQRQRCLKFQTSNFHTTQKLQVPFYLSMVAFLKIGAAFFGAFGRRWWLKQSSDRQEKYKRWIWERRNMLYGSLGIFSTILVIFYLTHIEKDPVAKRPRFIILNKTEQADLGSPIVKDLLKKSQKHLISSHDRRYIRLIRIIKKLTKANKDIFANTQWTVSIINTPIANATVLPDGNIFVFSGIFNAVENDDQLAFILAHEMSHVLLLHSMELLSYSVLYELVYALPMFFIWFFFSKWRALFLAVGTGLLNNIFIWYPYKRRKEIEADEIAFELCAKSCMDVREIIAFWKLMRKVGGMTDSSSIEIPLLMYHPTHKQREEMLTQQLPKALELRRQANCPELSKYSRISQFDLENIVQNINMVL